MNQIIKLENVTFEYIEGVGVYDLDLEIDKETILGLIGPSGCGKTTTVRLILGLLQPDAGSITVLGSSPEDFSNQEREIIGYLPQSFLLYPDLSIQENLNFSASLYGEGFFKRKGKINEALELVQLKDVRKRVAKNLSGGMKKRLQLAAAILHQPKLILADEPTSGIDPVLRKRIWDYLREYRDQGNTLLVTTQYIGEAIYCDIVAVMDHGRILYVDTPDNLYKKALGGEIISISVPEQQEEILQNYLSTHQHIQKLSKIRDEAGQYLVTVENAGEMIPKLMEEFSQREDLTIIEINQYKPPFDEIYTTLIESKTKEDSIV